MLCYVHLLFTKYKNIFLLSEKARNIFYDVLLKLFYFNSLNIGMEGKKIWNNREMFKFIARYEYYRELWDTRSVLYKNKLKRTKALHSLASEFQTNVGEISKKIRALRSQFFQMYKKMYEDCDENGVASAFVTKWKYYRPLQFILVSRENDDNITDHSHPDKHMQKKYNDNIVSDHNDEDKAVLLIVQKQENMEKLHSRCNNDIIKCFDFEEHKLILANDQKVNHHTKKFI